VLDALHDDACRATGCGQGAGLMTRGAAISIALLALIALMLVMLLGRHGGAANSPAGADLAGMANPKVLGRIPMHLLLERACTRRTGNEYGVFDETTSKCVGNRQLRQGGPRQP
jgi:hypothetical protein